MISGNIKKLFFLGVVIITTNSFPQSENQLKEDECTFNGIQLYGKIQFVESFPDITVQIDESFPELKVKIVESFPDECGEWQIINLFPDIKIKYARFAEASARRVESFPGIP